MYSLPKTINAGGVDLKIRNDGDFRIVIDTFSLLENPELSKDERLLSALCIFYEDFDSVEDVLSFEHLDEAVEGMFEFFNAGRPEELSHKSEKVIDWESDSAIICSAVNNVAGKEIRSEEYLHWWTFISYYMAVGESILSTVVSIRDKILSGKTLEKWERQYRNENPQYFRWNSKTAEDMEIENMILTHWNEG